MLTVPIMPIAEVDIDAAYEGWRDHRSVAQANLWMTHSPWESQPLRAELAGSLTFAR